LSGSDGTLKMWNVRDGTVVRDLLTGITGVWQVVFEGRWCVAASNRNDTTRLDVWDFGNDEDEDWVGEPPGGMYDDNTEDEEEEDDIDQADVDAMDQDLEAAPSESETAADSLERGDDNSERAGYSDTESMDRDEGVEASRWAPSTSRSTTSHHSRHRAVLSGEPSKRGGGTTSSEAPRPRPLPMNDETPTRPRIRTTGNRRR